MKKLKVIPLKQTPQVYRGLSQNKENLIAIGVSLLVLGILAYYLFELIEIPHGINLCVFWYPACAGLSITLYAFIDEKDNFKNLVCGIGCIFFSYLAVIYLLYDTIGFPVDTKNILIIIGGLLICIFRIIYRHLR